MPEKFPGRLNVAQRTPEAIESGRDHTPAEEKRNLASTIGEIDQLIARAQKERWHSEETEAATDDIEDREEEEEEEEEMGEEDGRKPSGGTPQARDSFSDQQNMDRLELQHINGVLKARQAEGGEDMADTEGLEQRRSELEEALGIRVQTGTQENVSSGPVSEVGAAQTTDASMQEAVGVAHRKEQTKQVFQENTARAAEFNHLKNEIANEEEDRDVLKKNIDENRLNDLKVRKDSLEGTIKTRGELHAEVAGVNEARKEMLAAEAEYLGAMRKMKVQGKKALGPNFEQGVEMLRKRYNESRAAFSQAVNESAASRLQERHGADQERNEKVMRRYNRLVLMRDTIKRAEQERIHSEQEALDEKGKGVFRKALEGFGRVNQAMEKRLGKNGARAARILAVAGVGGAVGGLAIAGQRALRSVVGMVAGSAAGAAAGKTYERFWGSKRAAELREQGEENVSSAADIEKLEKAYRAGASENIEKKRRRVEAAFAAAFGVGGSVGTHFLFGLPSVESALGLTTEHVHSAAGTIAEHGAAKGNIPGMPEGTPLPPAVAEAVHQTDLNGWHEMYGNKVPYPGDVIAGKLVEEYSYTGHYPSVADVEKLISQAHETTGTATHVAAASSGAPASGINPEGVNKLFEHGGNAQEVMGGGNAAGHMPPPGPPAGPDANATAAVLSHEAAHHAGTAAESVSHAAAHTAEGVVAKGEGADALFGHLKESLREAYPDPSKAPPDVQHILNTPLQQLSATYGFAHHGESALMHTGDKLEFANGKLEFINTQGAHELAHVVDGKLVNTGTFGGDYLPNTVAETAHQAAAHTAQSAATAHATPPAAETVAQPAHEATAQSAAVAHEGPVVHTGDGGVLTDSEGQPVHSTYFGPEAASTAAPEAAQHAHTAVESATAAQHAPSTEGPAVTSGNGDALTSQASGEVVHSAEGTIPTGEHINRTVEAIMQTTPDQFHQHAESLLQSKELSQYAQKPIAEALYNAPSVSQPMHEQLVGMVMRSGVGPENNETLSHFLERAQEAVNAHGTGQFETGMNNLHVPIHETSLYADAQGQTVAFGGDYNARAFAAYEYLQAHPGSQVMVVGPDNANMVAFAGRTTSTGRVLMSSHTVAGPVVQAADLTQRVQ